MNRLLSFSCSDSLKKIGLLIQNVVKVTAIDLVTVTNQEIFGKKRLSEDKNK